MVWPYSDLYQARFDRRSSRSNWESYPLHEGGGAYANTLCPRSSLQSWLIARKGTGVLSKDNEGRQDHLGLLWYDSSRKLRDVKAASDGWPKQSLMGGRPLSHLLTEGLNQGLRTIALHQLLEVLRGWRRLVFRQSTTSAQLAAKAEILWTFRSWPAAEIPLQSDATHSQKGYRDVLGGGRGSCHCGWPTLFVQP